MGDTEQRASLEAIARELAAASAVLPQDDVRVSGAASELVTTRTEVEQIAKCRRDTCYAEPGEFLVEARNLRAESFRERDSADAQLQALRVEHAGLLVELAELEGRRDTDLQGSWQAIDRSREREDDLFQQCEDLDKQVRAAQDLLQYLSGQLSERGHVGVHLSRRRRGIEHKHAASTSESEISREILDVQETTEHHLEMIYTCCGQLEHALAEAHAQSGEHTEQLRTEWAQEKNQYRLQAEEVESRLDELHTEYAERWNVVERESRVHVHEKARVAAEARKVLEQEMAELDAQREREIILRKEKLAEQKQQMVERRTEMLVEMDAKLAERQWQIRERVESERQRCARLRGQQNRRAEELAKEVAETRANIEQVRESYGNQQPRSPHSPELPPLRRGEIITANKPPRRGLPGRP